MVPEHEATSARARHRDAGQSAIESVCFRFRLWLNDPRFREYAVLEVVLDFRLQDVLSN